VKQEREEGRLKRPPVHPTNLTPDELVGDDALPLLEIHFKAVRHAVTQEEHERQVRRSGLASYERRLVEEAYEKLRGFGIWPRDINEYGGIVWGVAVRSDLQNLVESLPLLNRKDFPLSVQFKEVPEEEHNG